MYKTLKTFLEGTPDDYFIQVTKNEVGDLFNGTYADFLKKTDLHDLELTSYDMDDVFDENNNIHTYINVCI